MQLNQRYEAAVFAQNNALEIAKAEEVILVKAIELLGEEGRKVLRPPIFASAEAALARKDLDLFFSVIREDAGLFIGKVQTHRYWAVIDAIGHWQIATNAYWPFVTQDDRKMYLGKVHETLNVAWQNAA